MVQEHRNRLWDSKLQQLYCEDQSVKENLEKSETKEENDSPTTRTKWNERLR